MYFIDRMDLGDKLCARLSDLKGQEPVILALTEESITACITLASKINAWIYPILTEKIYIPGDPRLMGMINDGGVFVWNPELSAPYRASIEMDYRSVLDDAKRVAFSKLNKRVSAYGEFSKFSLRGRILILTGDIIRGKMEMASAIEYLKDMQYSNLLALGGNVDPEVATFMRILTDRDHQLDVIPNMFDNDHYFDRQDSYSVDGSRQILINISHFWE